MVVNQENEGIMELPRLTECSLFQIHVPIQNDKAIGIADYRISRHNEIHILSKDKDGQRYYPDNYYISGEDARKYPLQRRSGIELRLIPINDLKVLVRV